VRIEKTGTAAEVERKSLRERVVGGLLIASSFEELLIVDS